MPNLPDSKAVGRHVKEPLLRTSLLRTRVNNTVAKYTATGRRTTEAQETADRTFPGRRHEYEPLRELEKAESRERRLRCPSELE
jgi:hypothetical protein